jgi:GT2 family glycosyltransferase
VLDLTGPPMPDDITFSVILPLYHRGDLLRCALAALRAIDYPADRFEVLVPGPPNDPAQAIVREAASGAPFRMDYVPVAGTTRAAHLNGAIAVSRGEFLAFADDDVFVLPDWLARLEAIFRREPGAAMVGGVDLAVDAEGLFDVAFDAALHSVLSSGRSRVGNGVRAGPYYPRLWNMALPRGVAMEAALAQADGSRQVFNPAVPVHEDVELGRRVRRLSRPIVFDPDLKVRHRRKTTFGAMVRRDFVIARTCRAEGLQPWGHRALSGALVAGAGLAAGAIFWPPLAWVLATLGGAYALLLAIVGAQAVIEKRRAGVLILAPLITAGLHLARAAGYLVGAKKVSGTFSETGKGS